jgi:signal transduction histidine kinase
LSERMSTSTSRIKPGWIGVVAIYLAFAAVAVRTLVVESNRPLLSQYIGLELAFILLYTFILWKYTLPSWLLHGCIGLETVLVYLVFTLRPEFDFSVNLFLLLTYPVSLYFSGRTRWIWIGILVVLTGGLLIFYLGVLRVLALSLTTIAAEIVIPTYIIVNHEIEVARTKSQALLDELQITNRQLQSYADQVEELAATQERNRLARELHDTVNQLIFTISLTTRSAQLLLDKDPHRAAEELHNLQVMAGNALSQLRSLITQLRPPKPPSDQLPA